VADVAGFSKVLQYEITAGHGPIRLILEVQTPRGLFYVIFMHSNEIFIFIFWLLVPLENKSAF